MASWLILASFMAAAAQPAAPPLAASASAPRLADLPNVEITDYQVSGDNIRQIHRSLKAASPRDPATGKAVPATSSWNVAAGVKWTRTGGRCDIMSVDLRFSAKANMPRLTVSETTPAPVVAAWNDYVAQLDARQARQLRFAYDRRERVERAIREAGCLAWEAAAALAIDRIRREQLAAFQDDLLDQPKLLEPKDSKRERRVEPSVNTSL